MTEKWTSQKIAKMTAAGTGVVIRYENGSFPVELAKDNGYGAIEAKHYVTGEWIGMDFNEEWEILTTFNL